MKTMKTWIAAAAAVSLAALAANARADAVTDWNLKCAELITEARMGTPPAVRLMAMVQTASANAVDLAKPAGAAAAEAAIAAAHRGVLARLMPAQQAAVDAAYQAALARVADGAARAAGIAAGERAAAELLARRADDGAGASEAYRPLAAAGAWVPTAAPAIPQWPQRKPWLMPSAAQFRPGPPPALASAQWARDFDEVRELGGKASTRRSAEQTEAARFWDYSLPAVYHGVVRSVALQPGRDLARNARLFAVVSQAMDDALIGVFDAKYHHHFWRPVTAIRNADIDGNDATQRDPSWASLIEAPMHPEYPSAHASLAAVVATVLKAELGGAPMPELSTSSPTARGAVRRWTDLDTFVTEVAMARIWGGIHFRAAADAGVQMGRQVGALAAQQLQRPD